MGTAIICVSCQGRAFEQGLGQCEGEGRTSPCSDAIAPQICSRFNVLEWFGLTPSLAEEPGKWKRRA